MGKGIGDRLTEDIINLKNDLWELGIELQFVKVNSPPILDGNEVDTIYGIPFRTHIGEHEADNFLMSAPTVIKEEEKQ